MLGAVNRLNDMGVAILDWDIKQQPPRQRVPMNRLKLGQDRRTIALNMEDRTGGYRVIVLFKNLQNAAYEGQLSLKYLTYVGRFPSK